MASPEVCRALPITTWSTASAGTPARARASRDAWAPSSRADTSLNAPTYSAMGVRAPPRITTSLGCMAFTLDLPGPSGPRKDGHHITRLDGLSGATYARKKTSMQVRLRLPLVLIALNLACAGNYDNPFSGVNLSQAPPAEADI